MKNDKKSAGSAVFTLLAPLWLFAALVMVYALSLSAMSLSYPAAIICALMPFVLCSGVCVFLKIRNSLKEWHVVTAVMLLGIAVNVWYILATPWNERQHDVFVFDTQGHAGYIYTMMKTGKLPETNTGLFYHPPFHPYIMSLAGNLLSRAINTADQVFEALQILPAYYSLMCGWVFLKILDFLRLRQNTKLLFFAAFTLHPTLIIFSGSINNDVLCLLLSMCTMLYTLRFMERQSLKNALPAALFLGLAMMTKLSAVTIAPVIAVIFIIRIIFPTEGRSRRSVIINELCFGALSIPLGMWYPIRNLIKFGQPLGYVMPIGISHPLYCGDRSIYERFLSIPLSGITDNIYCLPEEDYNIPIYIVKCSVFGEFTFDFPQWAAIALLILNCALIVFCVAAAAYAVVKKNPCGILLTAVSVVSVLFFIWFNIKYPNGCSMDFRYIALCLPASFAAAAVFFDSMADKKRRFIAAIPIVLFTALTVCLYLSEELLII